ncbi:MAG: CsbD family protein [Ornithinimicrobium sp.]
MGIADKISNSSEEAKGNAKEAAGDATNNEQMQAEGKTDQGKADAKQTGEKVKDAWNDATK